MHSAKFKFSQNVIAHHCQLIFLILNSLQWEQLVWNQILIQKVEEKKNFVDEVHLNPICFNQYYNFDSFTCFGMILRKFMV